MGLRCWVACPLPMSAPRLRCPLGLGHSLSWNWPVPWEVSSSILGPCPLDAGDTSPLATARMSADLAERPLGREGSPWRNARLPTVGTAEPPCPHGAHGPWGGRGRERWVWVAERRRGGQEEAPVSSDLRSVDGGEGGLETVCRASGRRWEPRLSWGGQEERPGVRHPAHGGTLHLEGGGLPFSSPASLALCPQMCLPPPAGRGLWRTAA